MAEAEELGARCKGGKVHVSVNTLGWGSGVGY